MELASGRFVAPDLVLQRRDGAFQLVLCRFQNRNRLGSRRCNLFACLQFRLEQGNFAVQDVLVGRLGGDGDLASAGV